MSKYPTAHKVQLGELFTFSELQKAFKIIDQNRDNRTGLNVLLIDQIITDALPRINVTTRQENDASYLAYVLQHAHAHVHAAERLCAIQPLTRTSR